MNYKYIPTLKDGSASATGEPFANKGGYTHNGAESLIKQSDAIMLGTAGDGSDTFWSADGVAQGSKSYADLRAHPNGAYTLWMKCQDIGGVPHYLDLSQYTFGREFNAGETQKNENYYGDNCGTGQSALRDVNGDLVTDVGGNVIFTA